MGQLEYNREIVENKGFYTLVVSFSDNPYVMSKSSDDMMEMVMTQNILDCRVNDFMMKKSNVLKTSDLGFNYTK